MFIITQIGSYLIGTTVGRCILAAIVAIILAFSLVKYGAQQEHQKQQYEDAVKNVEIYQEREKIDNSNMKLIDNKRELCKRFPDLVWNEEKKECS